MKITFRMAATLAAAAVSVAAFAAPAAAAQARPKLAAAQARAKLAAAQARAKLAATRRVGMLDAAAAGVSGQTSKEHLRDWTIKQAKGKLADPWVTPAP